MSDALPPRLPTVGPWQLVLAGSELAACRVTPAAQASAGASVALAFAAAHLRQPGGDSGHAPGLLRMREHRTHGHQQRIGHGLRHEPHPHAVAVPQRRALGRRRRQLEQHLDALFFHAEGRHLVADRLADGILGHVSLRIDDSMLLVRCRGYCRRRMAPGECGRRA